MTEIKHFCDRCNDRIESPDWTLMKLQSGPHRHDRPAVELCDECTRAVFEFIDAWAGDSVAPRPKKTAAAKDEHAGRNVKCSG